MGLELRVTPFCKVIELQTVIEEVDVNESA